MRQLSVRRGLSLLIVVGSAVVGATACGAVGPDDEATGVSDEVAEDVRAAAEETEAAGWVDYGCCAKCWNRYNYYYVPTTWGHCWDAGASWCSVGDRGGVQDVYWGGCETPP